MKLFRHKKTLVLQSNRAMALFNFVTGRFSHGWAGARFVILMRENLNAGQHQRLVKHEYQHIKDMKELGYIKFVRNYFRYSKLVGYNRNPFELRAREAEGGGGVKSVKKDGRIRIR